MPWRVDYEVFEPHLLKVLLQREKLLDEARDVLKESMKGSVFPLTVPSKVWSVDDGDKKKEGRTYIYFSFVGEDGKNKMSSIGETLQNEVNEMVENYRKKLQRIITRVTAKNIEIIKAKREYGAELVENTIATFESSSKKKKSK